MRVLLIFASVLCCSGYRFQLEEGEKGRFIYEGHSGSHRYCTKCATGLNSAVNTQTQQLECINKNYRERMPNNGTIPICKEEVSDGIIPGCGLLPATDGLNWKTKSGRSIQNNMSTVYEVYFPECPRTSALESNYSSIRCGENLMWNVDPTHFRCLKGCGPLPNRFEWRLPNDSKAGNESLAGYTYIGLRRLGFKILVSITARCGRDSIWYEDPSQVTCESDECGCGLLPAADGLNWKTKSGRSIQNNMSTVYEVYFPECPRTSTLESNYSSIRCEENLTWNVNLTNFRCLKGCGPLPKRFEWRLANGSEAGNESYAGYTYIGLCRSEFKILVSITARCGRDSIWQGDPSRVTCKSEECEKWYCGVEIKIVTSVMVLLLIFAISLYCVYVRIRKKHAKRSIETESSTESDVKAPMIVVHEEKCEPDRISKFTSDNESCDETINTRCTSPDLTSSEEINSEGSRTPVEHCENPFSPTKMYHENIKVFQTLRTEVNQEGILEFTVQMGELVYIATKEIMKSSNGLQIKREDQAVYRGLNVYPFLHCIQKVESLDAGLYYWTTTESWPKRNIFSLKVEDRGQPDGLESVNSRLHLKTQLSCEEQQDILKYYSSILNSKLCLTTPSMASISKTEDEPVCKLKINTIFRDNSLEDLRKQLCYCLDSSVSCQSRGCWRVIAKTFLNRTDAYISSVEWHRKGDPDNGPSNLILNDLCRANQNLTIGQLIASLPPNLDLLNNVLRFHNDCPFCNRLLYEIQQTEPKEFCSA